MSKTVIIANDHGAIDKKNEVIAHLTSRGFDCKDLGVFDGESADYPDQAVLVTDAVNSGEGDFGIVLCGTGIGISMAANKVDGIRCALVHDVFTATMAKEHNNANVLALGGRTEVYESVANILNAFLDAEFAGGRHKRRIDKVKMLEK